MFRLMALIKDIFYVMHLPYTLCNAIHRYITILICKMLQE